MFNRVKSFTTSYYKDAFLKIDTSFRNALVISGKGDLKNGYIWVKITDSKDNLIKNYMMATGNDGSFYSSEHVLLGAAVYKITLLMGQQHYGNFSSNLPEIPYVIENGEGSILLSEVYIKNVILFLAGRKATGDKYLGESFGIQCRDKRIAELAENITAGAVSEYEKITAVHDWVAQNIAYDTKALYARTYNASNQDALTTLNARKAVCQGYSNLTAALLRAVKIKAGIISGVCLGYGFEKEWSRIDKNKINHVWNEAFADGRWIVMDVTWNSGYIGEDRIFHPKISYAYFDTSLEMLSFDHLILSHNA